MVIPVGAQSSLQVRQLSALKWAVAVLLERVSCHCCVLQVLKLVDKDKDGNVHEKDLMAVAFVPLTEPGTDPFVGKDEE